MTQLETPRLSPSIAKVLLNRSPLHAWQAHRLLGGTESTPTEATLDGRIFESIIFGLDLVDVLPYDAYRSNEAKAARDASLRAKRIPIIESKWAEYAETGQAMLKSIQAGGVSFKGGSAQQTILWESEGVECKAVLDYLTITANDYTIDDLKCVDDASPDAIARAVTNYGWDIQAAAYVEAVESKYPHLAGRGRYRLVPVEKDAPFAANPREFSGAFQTIGNMKWQKAKSIWGPCLKNNNWPGYPAGTIAPYPWQIAQAEAM